MARKSMVRTGLLVAIIAALSATLGFYLGHVLEGRAGSENSADPPVEVAMPDERPVFSLPDTAGQTRRVQEWDGKVLVINFWATWCPPCREEIPEFVVLQQKYATHGLQFIGIAIDEPDAVLPFMQATGINYPVLLGQLTGVDLSRKYGNRWGALPFTAVIDRQGHVVSVKGGSITRAEMEQKILPHL
ncbi:MAG: TlpA disulfide reductase family protein [Gammaproteobacteria bacterium]